jgi:predicted DNA-binding transcriptional regulator AlpA
MNEQHTHAMTEQEVAQRLSLSAATLRAWRLRGRGPRYVRFGRAVRYLASDVEQFVRESVIAPDARLSGTATAIKDESIR